MDIIKYILDNIGPFDQFLDPLSAFLLSMTCKYFHTQIHPQCNAEFCICGKCDLDYTISDDELQGRYAGAFVGSGKTTITGRMILRLGTPDLIKKLPYRADYYKFLPIIAKRGLFELLLQFAPRIQHNKQIKEKIMWNAVRYRRKEIVLKLHEWGCLQGWSDNEDLFEAAVEANSLEMVKLLQHLGYQHDFKQTTASRLWQASEINEELVEFLLDRFPEGIPEDAICENEEYGKYKNIKIIEKLLRPENSGSFLAQALNCADLDLVRYLVEEKHSTLDNVFVFADTKGLVKNTAVVEYVLAKEIYTSVRDLFKIAIKEKSLETVEYFLNVKHHTPESADLYQAAYVLSPAILKLLYKSGCRPGPNLTFGVVVDENWLFGNDAEKRKQEVYDLLKSWECPWGEDTFDRAVNSADFALCNFMVKNGYETPTSMELSQVASAGLPFYKLFKQIGVTFVKTNVTPLFNTAYYVDYIKVLEEDGYTPDHTESLVYRALDNEDERLVDWLCEHPPFYFRKFADKIVERKNPYILKRVAKFVATDKHMQNLLKNWVKEAKANNNQDHLDLLGELVDVYNLQL